jgi:hypothetical protein
MNTSKNSRRTALALTVLGLASGTLATLSVPITSYAAGRGPGGPQGPRPAGTPSGTPRPTPPSGTQPGRPGQPSPGHRDELSVLAGAIGRALTAAEKAAITASATTRATALKAAGDAYRAQVATALGLSAADLDAKIQAYIKANPGKRLGFNALLAAALGRPLTTTETSALAAAATARDAAAQAAIEAYRASVAATLGLSVADLDAKVTAYLQGQGGPNCPPKPGATPTAPPSSTIA